MIFVIVMAYLSLDAIINWVPRSLGSSTPDPKSQAKIHSRERKRERERERGINCLGLHRLWKFRGERLFHYIAVFDVPGTLFGTSLNLPMSI